MNAGFLGFLVNYDINPLIYHLSTKLSSIEPYIRQIFQEQWQFYFCLMSRQISLYFVFLHVRKRQIMQLSFGAKSYHSIAFKVGQELQDGAQYLELVTTKAIPSR